MHRKTRPEPQRCFVHCAFDKVVVLAPSQGPPNMSEHVDKAMTPKFVWYTVQEPDWHRSQFTTIAQVRAALKPGEPLSTPTVMEILRTGRPPAPLPPSRPPMTPLPTLERTYRHYKGTLVTVVAVVRHHEAPNEFWVVYVHDGEIWTRPLEHDEDDAWNNSVMWSDGVTRRRFEPDSTMLTMLFTKTGRTGLP